MFGLIKELFIGLLTELVICSNHTKCVLLSNQKYMSQLTLISLHPNEYSKEFNYDLFRVKLDRCVGSCNNLNGLSNKVCVPNNIEDLTRSMLNIITGINELKTSTKHVSCKCKYKFDGRKCNSNQCLNNINVYASVENIIYVKKIIFGILLHVVAKMEHI